MITNLASFRNLVRVICLANYGYFRLKCEMSVYREQMCYWHTQTKELFHGNDKDGVQDLMIPNQMKVPIRVMLCNQWPKLLEANLLTQLVLSDIILS